MHYAKIAVGLIVILLSFVYIMKNKSQSMMDALTAKRKQEFEEAQKKAQESESTDSLTK